MRAQQGALFSRFAARIFSAALQFVFLVTIARTASLSDYGHLSAWLATAAILMSFLGAGLPTYLLRADGDDAALNSSLAITFLLGLAGALGLIVAAIVIDGAVQAWTFTAATYLFAEMTNAVCLNWLLGSSRARVGEVLMILFRAVPMATVLCGLLIPGLNVIAVAGLGYLLTIPVTLAATRFRLGPFLAARSLLRAASPYWRVNVASVLQLLDVVLISKLLGSLAAGGYAGAFRLASPVHIVTSTLSSLMVPDVARSRAADRSRVVARFLRLGYVYSATVALVAPATAWIGPWLLGPQFEPYRWLFPLLMLNSAISVLNQLFSSYLYAIGKAPSVARSTAFATLTGLGILTLGAFAGSLAIATFGTMSIQLLLLLLLAPMSSRSMRGSR